MNNHTKVQQIIQLHNFFSNKFFVLFYRCKNTDISIEPSSYYSPKKKYIFAHLHSKSTWYHVCRRDARLTPHTNKFYWDSVGIDKRS